MTTRRTRTTILPLQALAGLFIAIAACAYTACSNSESVGNINGGETSPIESAFNVHETADSTTPASGAQQDQSPSITKYIPLDDTEYPYAGIPRIVIETENRREIKDRETEIPAKLQIWGEKAPESEIMELTIRGRGNSSWTGMPKKSYKIELLKKTNLFHMPSNKDWALISNYADKTLMKNFLMYNLSSTTGLYYTPNNKFVELFINNSYCGVYLLTETIKVDKNRINIPKTGNSFLAEIDFKHKENEQYVISNLNKPFRIHSPKGASDSEISFFLNHINEFESYLANREKNDFIGLQKWLYLDDYIKHFWIQEISKNCDAAFFTSVFFSWQEGQPIHMGPVWDFDLAFGGHTNADINNPEGWLAKDIYWNRYLFKDSSFTSYASSYWKAHKSLFNDILDTLDIYKKYLNDAAKNNYKKWNALKDTSNYYHHKAYSSYDEAVDDLKAWIQKRYLWIDKQIDSSSKKL